MAFTATREELAWAGGLFEGEGCFTGYWMTQPGSGNRYWYVRAALGMTDQEIVERFCAILGVGVVSHKPVEGYKTQWVWYVQTHERVQHVLAVLWPWLGARRRLRGAEVLSLYRETRVAA